MRGLPSSVLAPSRVGYNGHLPRRNLGAHSRGHREREDKGLAQGNPQRESRAVKDRGMLDGRGVSKWGGESEEVPSESGVKIFMDAKLIP